MSDQFGRSPRSPRSGSRTRRDASEVPADQPVQRLHALVDVGRVRACDGTETEHGRNRIRLAVVSSAVVILLAVLTAWTPSASAPSPLPESSRDLTGAAGADCDTATAADEAVTRLGEGHVALFVRPQADLDAVVPAGSAGYAEPSPDGNGRIVLSDDHRVLPCRFVWSTVAHEWTHVLQYRACGGCDLYADGWGPRAEIIADCGSVLTGWRDYYPYLNERGYDCTPSELNEAKGLRRWAR